MTGTSASKLATALEARTVPVSKEDGGVADQQPLDSGREIVRRHTNRHTVRRFGAWAGSIARISSRRAHCRTIPQEIRGGAALGVSVEQPRADLQRDGGAQPDLPMRKWTGGDGEAASQVQIGRHAPTGQHGRGHRRGRQRGRPATHASRLILLPLSWNKLRAPCEPYPDYHGNVITNLPTFAID